MKNSGQVNEANEKVKIDFSVPQSNDWNFSAR